MSGLGFGVGVWGVGVGVEGMRGHHPRFPRGESRWPHVCQIGCTSLERHDGPLGEFLNQELYRTVQLLIQEQLLRSNEKPFQGGLVFKARRLLYHSSQGRE